MANLVLQQCTEIIIVLVLKRCTAVVAIKQHGGAGRWIQLKGQSCGKIVFPTENRSRLKALWLFIQPIQVYIMIKVNHILTVNYILKIHESEMSF